MDAGPLGNSHWELRPVAARAAACRRRAILLSPRCISSHLWLLVAEAARGRGAGARRGCGAASTLAAELAAPTRPAAWPDDRKRNLFWCPQLDGDQEWRGEEEQRRPEMEPCQGSGSSGLEDR